MNPVSILVLPALWRVLRSENEINHLLVWQLATVAVFFVMSRALYTRHLLYLSPVISLLCAQEIIFVLQKIYRSLTKSEFLSNIQSKLPVKLALGSGVVTLLVVGVAVSPGLITIFRQQRLVETDTTYLSQRLARMTTSDEMVLSDYAGLNFYAQRASIPQAGIISQSTAQSGHINADILISEIEARSVNLILLQLEPKRDGHLVFMPDYDKYVAYVTDYFTLIETIELSNGKFALYSLSPQ
jgi:hypothetical protein